jgi:phage-related protein
VQDASRLRFAAHETGVSYETLAKSTGKLSKALVAANGSEKAHAAMIKTLGFEYRDAAGHVLPMSQMLPKLADKFSKMQAGPEKTALAMKLFGKAGTDMLPFLNKGASGIAELEKQSDKFGLTLTGKNIDALKKAKMSQREWNASLDGLKVQIGAQVLPMMNKLVGFIRDHIIPVVTAITGFVQKHKNAVMIAVTIIGTLIVGLKAWAIAQAVLNAVMAVNPIALLVIGLVALAAGLYLAYKKSEAFRDVVKTAFAVVKAVVMDSVVRPIQMIVTVVSAVISFVRSHWKLILGILTGPIGAAVIVIISHWNSIKNTFGAVVTFIRAKVGEIVSMFTSIPGKIASLAGKMLSAGKSLVTSFWNGIKSAASGAAHFVGGVVSDMAQGLKNAFNDILNLPWKLPRFKIGAMGHYVHVGGQTLFPRMAEGGMTTGPGMFVMGDNPSGHEVALPLDSPRTTKALGKALGAAGASGMSGGGLTVQVTFPSGVVLGTPAQVGVAIKTAVEAAVQQGVKYRIGRGVVT